MSYGTLARECGLRVGELTARLEAMMEVDAMQSEAFRAALLCQRLSPDRLPAPGFFEKARALGFVIEDPVGFIADQRRRLRAA